MALLHPLPAAASSPKPITCTLHRSSEGPPWSCRELLEPMHETLQELASSELQIHVQLEEVSTAGRIVFEARAWTISSKGRHLRHVARARAAAKDPVLDPRGRDRLAPRVARSALKRALRELASVAERSH
jgi:hypothetical protein